jgi:hypothetical protein
MKSNELKILENAINSDIWETQVLNSINFLKDSIENDVEKVITSGLKKSKNPKILSNLLKLIPYYIGENKFEVDDLSETIRKIVLNESLEEQVRVPAISLLGEITEYPEPSLRKIIESDSEKYLIHPDIIRRESDEMLNSDFEISANQIFDSINRITQARADGHFDHLNS